MESIGNAHRRDEFGAIVLVPNRNKVVGMLRHASRGAAVPVEERLYKPNTGQTARSLTDIGIEIPWRLS